LRRITTGALLAIGPTRWLTEECDAQHRCTTDVINRSTGAHHVLGPGSDSDAPTGAISPDGRTAAVLQGEQPLTLSVLDLTTGVDHQTRVEIDRDAAFDGTSMVWTPDGRWLIVADTTGHLVVVDDAGHSRVLTNRITRVSQLALRAGL
jgi:Tol biopolymer transport system component